MTVRTAVGALALTMIVLTASPAHADGELSLSRDGVTWVNDLTGPLFDPSIRWVPGDRRQETFLVRNDSLDTGDLTVDVLGSSVDSLMETRDLVVSASGGGGQWTEVDGQGSRRLVTRVLPASGVQAIEVQVALDPASTNISQSKALDLQLRVTLTERDPAAGSGSGGTPDAGGMLPGTGATRGLLALVAVGTLSLVLGSVLLDRRRRVDHG